MTRGAEGEKPAALDGSPGQERWGGEAGRRELAAGGVLVLLSVVALAVRGARLAVPLVDDAATSVAFGLTFSSGHGLRLSQASQVVEGFSSPLWTFLLSAAGPLGMDPQRFASALGEGLALAALPVYALWGTAARGRPRTEDAVGALLAACTMPYAYWTCSGMETGLQSLLLGVSGLLLLGELRRGRGATAGFALGALCLTRPEGVLYAVAAGLFWIAWRVAEKRPLARRDLSFALGALVLPGGYLLFRRLYFDAWLPNTYYAKRVEDFHVGDYFSTFAVSHLPLVLAGAAGVLVAVAFGAGAARRQGILALLFAMTGLYFILHARGDWMRQWRFIAPLIPCWGQCFGAGLSALRDVAPQVGGRGLRVRALIVAAVLAVGGEGWIASARGEELRTAPELPAALVAGQARAVGEHARSLGLIRPRLAMPDIGGLSLALRDAEVIDTGRLADTALAQHFDNPAAAEDYLVSEVEPDYLDLHGPALHYATELPHFAERYVPLSDMAGRPDASQSVWILAGLTATFDPRCPGGRASVLALAPVALAARVEQTMEAARPEEALRVWRCALAWRLPASLPGSSWREGAARRADALSVERETAGQTEPALRYESLATVLSGGEPRRRHRTERLRERLFPPPRPRG